ncbi:MAG: hypothetical protein WBO29_11410 [Albidovulum sp.]
MVVFKSLHLRRLSRTEWLSVSAMLVAVVAYLMVLGALDRRAEAYFIQMRTENPVVYLDQLRESRGFAAFLPAYMEMNGFDTFRPQPPNFMVGRWTMRSDTLRLVPGTAPATCSDPVTFDYGLYLTVESGGIALPVQYRIASDKVEMKSRSDAVFDIDLAIYGSQLDHIEFVPPGRSEKVFAYLCGR